MTQPAPTKAVQKLERQLEDALIFRVRQLAQLTDLDKLVLPMVERTLVAVVSIPCARIPTQGIASLKIPLDQSESAIVLVQPLSEVEAAAVDRGHKGTHRFEPVHLASHRAEG